MRPLRVNERKDFIDATVKGILYDSDLLKQYQQEPDVVLTEKLKDLNEKDKAVIKTEITAGVAEGSVPGFDLYDAKKILKNSLQSPSGIFNVFVSLNVVLFALGIGLFALAAVSGLVKGEAQFSIIFGAGGIATLIPVFFINPLKRISNAASDHTQIRTVVIGYWAQLFNIKRQIDQTHSASDFETIKKLNNEMSEAMRNATSLLQKYAETTIKETNQGNEKEIKDLQDRIKALEKKLSTSNNS